MYKMYKVYLHTIRPICCEKRYAIPLTKRIRGKDRNEFDYPAREA